MGNTVLEKLIAGGISETAAVVLNIDYDLSLSINSGTTQATGYLVNKKFTEILAFQNSNIGVLLPLLGSAVYGEYVIKNGTGASLNIFPGLGDQINALGANTAFVLTTGTTITFYASPSKWVTR